jgi:hypothetical protein
MGTQAYVEVEGNDVEDNEDSRIITIGNAGGVDDDDDDIPHTPRRINSSRLSGTPVVVICSFVVGCLFGSLAVLLGGYYWRESSPSNNLDCERATVFSNVDDEDGTTSNENTPERGSAHATTAPTEIRGPDDGSTQAENEMAVGGGVAASAFVILEERKHDPTAFT